MGISGDIARHDSAAKAAEQQTQAEKAQHNQTNADYEARLNTNTQKIDQTIQQALNGTEQKYQDAQQGIGDFFEGLKADEKTGNEGTDVKGLAGAADKAQRALEQVYNEAVDGAKTVAQTAHAVVAAPARGAAHIAAGVAKGVNHADTALKEVKSTITTAVKNGYSEAKGAIKSAYHNAVAGGGRLL